MPAFFKDFFETLTDLSKKKEIRYVALGILLGFCLFACPGRFILFILLGLGAVALYVLYKNFKRGNHRGSIIDLTKKE